MIADLAVILILLLGIAQFRTPPGARRGNLTAALAMAAALAVVLWRHPIHGGPHAWIASAVGVILGARIAVRVTMIRIPAMVALQHGAGGIAALLVSFVELMRLSRVPMPPASETAAILGLFVGAATFSGSMIAAGKLAAILRQPPTALPRHNAWLLAGIVLATLLAAFAGQASDDMQRISALIVLLAASIAIGALVAIRVGGADMPVLISFLNATAGLAAAFCGIAIQNRLLIACGAAVAASGSVLTHVMCRAMNRGLASVFTGVQPAAAAPPPLQPPPAEPPPSPAPPTPAEPPPAESPADPLARAVDSLKSARSVIIIPGYGMALAEAQEDVVQLAEQLAAGGRDVRFAVHPVAGRMPGHMHVVLAEADLDYGRLFEMKDVNDRFASTDVALIVGACDVVNPAAIHSTGTPISGMPILKAHEAKRVIVCNLDERPGYSGVDNPLYKDPRTILLLGDAKESIAALRERLSA